jgi:hypothetical protein
MRFSLRRVSRIRLFKVKEKAGRRGRKNYAKDAKNSEENSKQN